MPLYLHQNSLDQYEPCLRLGLVNNMPEAAFTATERQFLSLLDKGSTGIAVSVSLFALPGMLPAGQEGRYQDLERLMDSELDGLVVTGREPLTADLRAEPYWDSFCVLLEWAQKHTISTLWSCLAAHAAVLQMDGIARQRREEKYYGVFPCRQTTPHALTVRMPADLRVPHSRWNGLPQQDLVTRGYEVLTCTGDGEVDLFIKEGESLFVFAQGHPEYDTDTLLREYRRDLGRYLRNESEVSQAIPASYFAISTEASLTRIRERANGSRTRAILAESLAVLAEASIENTWAASAECLYRNWLTFLAERSRLRERPPLMTNTVDAQPMIAL